MACVPRSQEEKASSSARWGRPLMTGLRPARSRPSPLLMLVTNGRLNGISGQRGREQTDTASFGPRCCEQSGRAAAELASMVESRRTSPPVTALMESALGGSAATRTLHHSSDGFSSWLAIGPASHRGGEWRTTTATS